MQTLVLPFATVKLRLATGEEVVFPVHDANALHVDSDAERLATKFAERLQKELLDKGQLLPLLSLLPAGELQLQKITVQFPADPQGLSHPSFVLTYDCITQARDNQFWGMVPAFGLEAMANSEAELLDRLRELVQIDFSARKRLQNIRQVVSASWYTSVEVETAQLSLQALTLDEVAQKDRATGQLVLPKVAEKMLSTEQAAYGREAELAQMERIIKGRFGRNLLLVGSPGSGKTALVQELARRRRQLGIEAEFWETSASVLVKELTGDTGWQNALSLLVKELTLSGDVLYVGNLAELFEVGRYEGNSVSLAEYLRSPLGRGELTLVAECTPEERARMEARSPGYLAFFQVVQVVEPRQGLDDIVAAKVSAFGKKLGLAVDAAALREMVALHRRFSPYSGLPGKPIRSLEALLLGQAERAVFAKPKKQKAKPATAEFETSQIVDIQHVIQHFCEETGMPPALLDTQLPVDLDAIRNSFNASVFGQEHAVNAVVDMLATVKTGLSRLGKPIASFLFAGPTGVGKTELAKVLAEFMFGSRERMLRFDMSEYSSPWSVLRLIGDGHGADGVLTSAVRQEPFCVLLFDEIEKADARFYDLLLQILGEGRLTDGRGQLVNFCSAIVIMTTNIGAANLMTNRISWKREVDALDVELHITAALERHFRPEFFNRLDAVVAFAPLTRETVRYVVEREVDLLRKREGVRFRQLDLTVTEAACDYLAEVGFDAKYGARYLQRAIREQLAVPLAAALNDYPFDERLTIVADVQAGKISMRTEAHPDSFDLMMRQWDMLTLSEHVSFERRKLALLTESPLYLRLLSELDVLENEHRRTSEQFWNQEARAKRYSALLGAKAGVEKLLDAVNGLELEVALACMGQAAFSDDFYERFEQWKAAFFDSQVQLHSVVFPKRDICHLSIYGPKVLAPLQFYLRLFQAKGFDLQKASTVWYQGDTADTPYLLRSEDPKRLQVAADRPPRERDVFCGFELVVAAPAVFAYLKEEKGYQAWEHTTNELPKACYVGTGLVQPKIPEEIHRQAFYQKMKPGRVWFEGHFADSRLGLEVAGTTADALSMLVERLDEQFRMTITMAFAEHETGE